ncbi:MAG: hypothetical protein MZW92_15785 [Comamonadaceae bacterium]|nr:hypothetical protein [Comamonadaceae bacterium]
MRSLDVSVVRSGGRQPEQAAVPRGVRGVLRAARQPLDRALGAGRTRRQPRASSRAKAASPACTLRRDGRDVSLRDWALEIVDSMRGVCELLDEGDAQRPYTHGARRAGGQDARRVADAVGALAARDAHQRGIVLQLRAAHVDSCTSPTSWICYSPNASRQDEFAAEAAGVARAAGAHRSVGHDLLRRVSRALFFA